VGASAVGVGTEEGMQGHSVVRNVKNLYSHVMFLNAFVMGWPYR
jgi:hypothetical protein